MIKKSVLSGSCEILFRLINCFSWLSIKNVEIYFFLSEPGEYIIYYFIAKYKILKTFLTLTTDWAHTYLNREVALCPDGILNKALDPC